MSQTYVLRILRGVPGEQFWEEFELERSLNANVISALMEIQKNPIAKGGKETTPVAWEQACLEEVCGSCSMLINGKPRQACTALIEQIIASSGSTTITLAPLSKFPLVRDLQVDRKKMFESLKKTRSWIKEQRSSEADEFGPKMSPELQETIYALSTCMTCGCCAESCPQVNEHSPFMGPAPISQVRLFNAHPAGREDGEERLRALMDEDGISGCGNAQNCARVCPKNIPLTESIAAIGRDTGKQAFKEFLRILKLGK